MRFCERRYSRAMKTCYDHKMLQTEQNSKRMHESNLYKGLLPVANILMLSLWAHRLSFSTSIFNATVSNLSNCADRVSSGRRLDLRLLTRAGDRLTDTTGFLYFFGFFGIGIFDLLLFLVGCVVNMNI